MSFTNAQLAQQIADLISYWSSFNQEYSDWLGGAVDGGPGSDGKYPLTNWAGDESLVDSPAKLADNVSGYVGLAAASETAAAASAAAAATSESNAASSEAQATSDAAAAAASAAAAAVDEGEAASSAVVSTAQANLATDRAGYAQEWANKAEDSLVSAAAGGDLVDDYSALHHAAKASADAASASSDAASAAASAAAAATFNPALYAALADNETITGSWTFGADFFLGDVRFRQADSVIYPQTNDGATLGGGTNRFAAGYFTTLLAQTHLNMQTGEAIEDIADGWLRLNNNQTFSNGVYTPGNLRVESAFNVAGAATFEGYVNGALKVYESRQAAGLSLDTLLVDGVYHMSNATGTGHPTGETLAYGNLLVFDNLDVHAQIYLSRHNDGRVYVRSSNATDFTGIGWNRLWSSADFSDNSSNWDTAYGWGDHGAENYQQYNLAPASQPDAYIYINRDSLNPALYVMKESVTGGPVAKFGSGLMNSTTFSGGAFEIQADGGFTADGAATLRGQVTLEGSNGTTQNLELQGTAPTIYLSDTDASSRDFWIHVNSNNFYVLRDNADDGGWDSPHPLQLEADTDLAYIFGKRVTLHNEAHYVSGSANGIKAVTGTYGAVQSVGSTGGYGGFSMDGYFVWMNSGTSHCGLYDDINNDWMILAYPNADVRLYYDGAVKFVTNSEGVDVTGQIMINDGNTEIAEGSGNAVRIRTNSGWADFGAQNTGYCHMQTDRGAFYMNKRLDTVGYNRYYQQGAYYANGSSSYVSGKVTYSTSAATGGSSGDIWFQYT